MLRTGLRVCFRGTLRIGAAAVCLALALPGVQAGILEDDEARKAILDLRTRLEQANEQRKQGDAELAAQLAQTNAQIATQISDQLASIRRSLLDLNNQLESQRADNARLRGQLEGLARDIAELQRKQKDVLQGLDDRFRRLEPVSVTLEGATFTAEPEEKRQFDEAMEILRKGDFDKAAAAFQAFGRRYPTSGYGLSTRFWLGNAQYGKRDYKDAVTTFRAFVASAPEHIKAAEALLAIANCQIELKDGKAARRTIDELLKTYPKSEAAQAGRDRLAAIRP